MKEYSLKKNPFYVIGATPRDTDQQLLSRAVDTKLLTGQDTHKEQEALLTPSGRLEAEISFLPRLDDESIQKIRETLENKKTERLALPSPVFEYEPSSSLALFNGVFSLLDTWPMEDAQGAAAAALSIAGICSMLSVSSAMEDINEDRKAGERELVEDQTELLIRLKEHEREVIASLCGRISHFSLEEQVRMQELLTDAYCDPESIYYRLYVLDEMVSMHLAHQTAGRAAKLKAGIRDGIRRYKEVTASPRKSQRKKLPDIKRITDDLSQWDHLTTQGRRIALMKGYTQEDAHSLFAEMHAFFCELVKTFNATKAEEGKFTFYIDAQLIIKAICKAFWDLQPKDRELVTKNAKAVRVDL